LVAATRDRSAFWGWAPDWQDREYDEFCRVSRAVG